MGKKKKTEETWHGITRLERISLIIGICGVIFGILGTVLGTLNTGVFGEVEVLPPSGYVRIKGIHPFPSDHLIIPVEWNNTKGSSVLVRKVCLYLTKIDSKTGEETTTKFTMAGVYDEISNDEFEKRYAFGDSFVADARSITYKVIVFHHEDWANESGYDDTGYYFSFAVGDQYRVEIGYALDDGAEIIVPFINELPIKKITVGPWDWWSLNE